MEKTGSGDILIHMDGDFYRWRARKRLISIAVTIVVVVAGGVVLYRYFSSPLSVKKLTDIQSSVENFAVAQIKKQISTPSPLRAPQPAEVPAPSVALSRAGILADTNLQRKENGELPPLSENLVLDDIAEARLSDMFQKQYFAHVAPDGGSAETVAKSAGYDYIMLGENLALGNYAGDEGVVEAWMNSPGHRANILNSHYTELGVAAGEGKFGGEDTWLAVQVFGKPASACLTPDPNIKSAIDSAQSQLSELQAEILAERAQINALVPQNDPATYNQKVDEYNGLANQYNVLLTQTKPLVSIYNGEVGVFNRCIGS